MSTRQATVDPRSAIGAANRDFMEAYMRGDAAGVAALYTVNGQLLPPRSDFITGRAAIAGYWQEAMNIGTRKLETTELEFQGEIAHEVGRYYKMREISLRPILREESRWGKKLQAC
jgi:ketosteroid isomerase-like protein